MGKNGSTLCLIVIPISICFKDTDSDKVSVLEHFMFFACLYSSCIVLFNVKTASFCHYS